jgi:alpha-1,2-mannosyltransferase
MIGRLWSLRDDHPAFVVVFTATVGVLVVWPVVDFYLRLAGIGIPFGFNDFGAYSIALDKWAESGTIYSQAEDGGFHGSYLYPPVTLLTFYPFDTFEFTTGAILFNALELALLWVGLEASARVLGYEPRIHERLVALVALFGFQPALRDFKWAQISTLLAALLCFAFYTAELGEDERSRWHDYASGALTTLASAFKLFFATSGAHLLRDRRRLLGALTTAGVLLVASVAIFGLDVHRTYLDVLMWGKGWGDTRPPAFWDVTAAYRPFAALGSLNLPVKIVGVLGVIALSLAARGDDATTARRGTFALGVAAVPLLAPQADSHDLVILLLPALVLLAIEFDQPDGYPVLPVLAVLLVHLHRYVLEVIVAPPAWVPLGSLLQTNAALLQPGVWGTLLLGGLAAYRVSEHATLPQRERS